MTTEHETLDFDRGTSSLKIEQPTKVICPKHGTHPHTITSTITGHRGTWCMICALEKLGEPLPTTADD